MKSRGRENYPHTRVEECSWQPEEVARHLSSLAQDSAQPSQIQQSASTHLLHQGWSSRQVGSLRSKYGANLLKAEEDEPKNWIFEKIPFLEPILSALWDQLKEPLILMLLFSAALSIALGNTSDAISIGIALLIVSLVAAVQEYRSEQALEKLANLVPPTCTCLRDGHVMEGFPAHELVVGDLVVLATGDRVPADCRVVDSVELRVDESNLTGENHPVSKTGEGLDLGNSLTTTLAVTDQTNVVFAGTLVNAGRGRALVLAVGSHTEFGKVATELQSVTTRKSPLQNKIDELGKRLAYLSSLAIALIALLGLLLGRPFLETLTVAVSLAVAAIPEGLPICTTVTLALGVLRMSKRNAIVKKLPVVESLGCATAVASDKTGTLTQNEMTVRAAYLLAFPQRKFGFTGVGYDLKSGNLVSAALVSGTTSPETVTVQSEEYLAMMALLHAGCLCNNATLETSAATSTSVPHSGQPTEVALLVAAAKARIPDPRPQYQRLQEIPFSSERKRMEVKARPIGGSPHPCTAFQHAVAQAPTNRSSFSRNDNSLYFVKGMPESILADCTTYTGRDGKSLPLDVEMKSRVLSNAQRMAASGLRVLAVAYGKSVDTLTLAGVVGMEDPPREGVAESVFQLRQGGVRVMMVTGDSQETAMAIAKRCGIVGDPASGETLATAYSSDSLGDLSSGSSVDLSLDTMEVGKMICMGGDELEEIKPHALVGIIQDIRVFYRVAPRHKLAIVRALQENGDIVAMTGDGTFYSACKVERALLFSLLVLTSAYFTSLLNRCQ